MPVVAEAEETTIKSKKYNSDRKHYATNMPLFPSHVVSGVFKELSKFETAAYKEALMLGNNYDVKVEVAQRLHLLEQVEESLMNDRVTQIVMSNRYEQKLQEMEADLSESEINEFVVIKDLAIELVNSVSEATKNSGAPKGEAEPKTSSDLRKIEALATVYGKMNGQIRNIVNEKVMLPEHAYKRMHEITLDCFADAKELMLTDKPIQEMVAQTYKNGMKALDDGSKSDEQKRSLVGTNIAENMHRRFNDISYGNHADTRTCMVQALAMK